MSRFVNKAIYSVVREEYKGQSISDAFLYLVKVVIKIKEYPHVSIQELCNDFQDFCGFSIPYHPMTVIVGTLKKQGYLKVGKIGALIPDLERIKEEVSVEDLNREQEALDEISSSSSLLTSKISPGITQLLKPKKYWMIL